MEVAIVGADGYIGSHLSALLKDRGYRVYEYNPLVGECLNPHSGVVIEGFKFPESLEAVVYLAQSPYYRETSGYAWHLLTVNALSALKVAELSIEAGAQKFIYASTGNVYAPSFCALSEQDELRRDNWYSLSKVHAEECLDLLRSKLDVTVVRPFGIFGPRQKDKLVANIIDSVASRKEIFLNRNPHDPDDTGGLSISLCYINDAVDIISKLLKVSSLPVVNLAGDEAVNIATIAKYSGQLLHKEPILIQKDITRDFNLLSDNSLLKQVTDCTFIAFEEGLEKTVDAYLRANE